MNRAFRLVGLWGVAALCVGIASAATIGCSETDDSGTTDDELHSALRTKDNLLTNEELLGQASSRTVVPTADQIQKFLEKTPHKGVRSILADKKVLIDDGTESPQQVPVSQAISDAAKAGGINPLELLVRLQLEQGLVSKKAGDLTDAQLESRLKYAMGCGCPHAPICQRDPEKYTGFYQQISCAVHIIKAHMDTAKSSGKTSSGWGVGIDKTTEDQAEITPENEATAVLYTYTPYAGEDFGGEKSAACKNAKGEPDYCSGAALHTWLWDSYASAISGKTLATDAGTSSSRDATTSTYDAGPAVTVVEDDAGTDLPPDEPPPVPGECSSDSDCSSNNKGGVCLTDSTCGCYADSDCRSTQRCDTTSNICRTKSTGGNPGGNTGGNTGGGLPRPNGADAGFSLFDAGYGNTDQAAATPPPTAPRAADDPAQRPAPGATVGDMGYSTNNPYGDGTSSTDGGKKKKANAAKDSGGCSVGAAGTPSDLPSAFFLVAGAASILAGRRRRKGT